MSPQHLRFEPSWPNPKVPEGWALVRVRASGICGSDLGRIMKTGAYQHRIIPGHEFAGVVEQAGTGSFRTGDRVAILPIIPCQSCQGCQIGPFHCEQYDFIGSRRDGGFAELCAVPESNLFKLPAKVSDEEGTFIEPLSVALHVLRRSGMQPGARVLVFGGGAIGILTAQWAKMLGSSEVVLADIRDESLAIAQDCGIGKTVNPLSEEFTRVGEFDNVFEAAGSSAALLDGIAKTTARGALTVVGRDVKDTVIPLELLEKFMRKELDMKGCWGYDNRGELEFIYECLNARQFSVKPMITQRISLEEGPVMIQKMWHQEIFYCKTLFAIE